MAPCVRWNGKRLCARGTIPQLPKLATTPLLELRLHKKRAQIPKGNIPCSWSSKRNCQINALKVAHSWVLGRSHMSRYLSLALLASQLKTRSRQRWKLRCFPHFMGPIQARCGTRRELPVNRQSTFLSKIALGTLQKGSTGLSHRWQQHDLKLTQSSTYLSAFVSVFHHGCCPHFVHWALC